MRAANIGVAGLTFPVAHLEISDVAVTVVFAENGVENERERVYAALLKTLGTTDVVLLWQEPAGRTRFISPVEQRRFFEAMKYDQLLAQADGTVVLTQF